MSKYRVINFSGVPYGTPDEMRAGREAYIDRHLYGQEDYALANKIDETKLNKYQRFPVNFHSGLQNTGMLQITSKMISTSTNPSFKTEENCALFIRRALIANKLQERYISRLLLSNNPPTSNGWRPGFRVTNKSK